MLGLGHGITAARTLARRIALLRLIRPTTTIAPTTRIAGT